MIKRNALTKNFAVFAAFLLFVAGTFVIFACIETRDEDDGWVDALKIVLTVELLTLPLVLIAARKAVRAWLKNYGGLGIFAILGLFGLIPIFASPYVFLANDLSANGQVTHFKGSVTAKWIGSGKSKNYFIKIADEATKQPIRFALRPDEYNQVQIGEMFQRCMYVGGLGITYRWRYTKVQPSCNS